MLPILSASGVVGSSVYLLRDWPPNFSTMGLLTIDGALTEQGALLTELGKTILEKRVARGKSSALLPSYIGNSYHAVWSRLGRQGTLDGEAIGPIPLLGTGTLVETGPRIHAELLHDWRGQITSHIYQNGSELPMTEGGFPFDVSLIGPGGAMANEVQIHPGKSAETAYRWTAPATSAYLIWARARHKSAYGDGLTISVYAGGDRVWSSDLDPSAAMTFVGRVANLLSGQTIELRVGPRGTNLYDAANIELAFTGDDAAVTLLAFSV